MIPIEPDQFPFLHRLQQQNQDFKEQNEALKSENQMFRELTEKQGELLNKQNIEIDNSRELSQQQSIIISQLMEKVVELSQLKPKTDNATQTQSEVEISDDLSFQRGGLLSSEEEQADDNSRPGSRIKSTSCFDAIRRMLRSSSKKPYYNSFNRS